MSGLIAPTDHQPEARSDTPRAIAELARALEGDGPSPHVEQALSAAWDAMHGVGPVVQPRHAPAWPAWALPALGAVAALLIAAAWVIVSQTPGRGAPDDPVRVGLEAAVPGGPFEPPPTSRPVVPPDVRPSGAAVDRRAPVRRPVPAEGRDGARPHAPDTHVVRPAQVALGDATEPFVWIRGADEIEPGLGVHVVRVQVPRLRWDSGMPRRELVDADVLMGNDGQARAVRVVRTGTQ